MPKDYWKKAREVDHAKRARLERATGTQLSYEYVWDNGSGETQRSSTAPSLRNSVPSLQSLVRHSVEWIDGPRADAERAKKQLEQLGPTSIVAIPILMDAFRHSSPSVRRIATQVVTRIGKPTIPQLTKRLLAAKGNERNCIAECLAQLGEPAWSAVLSLMDHSESHVQQSATWAAAQGAVAYPLLWKAFTSGTERERKNARAAFVLSGSKAVPFLLECLERESLDRGILALSILGDMGVEAQNAVPVIAEIAKGADEYRVRAIASKAWNAIRLAKAKRSAAKKHMILSPPQSSIKTKQPPSQNRRNAKRSKVRKGK